MTMNLTLTDMHVLVLGFTLKTFFAYFITGTNTKLYKPKPKTI